MLQCVAVCCSVMQCDAVCDALRSATQHTHTRHGQICTQVYTRVWCSMVQCVAVSCAPSATQHTHMPQQISTNICTQICCSMMQSVAVSCSVLQGVLRSYCDRTHPRATYRLAQTSTLRNDAVYCSMLQCVAVCCSLLHCVALLVRNNKHTCHRQISNKVYTQVCCSMLHCVAVFCSVCCAPSALQCGVEIINRLNQYQAYFRKEPNL